MLQHPIPLQRPPLPWLVRAPRQGLAGLWRRMGWPKATVRVSGVAAARAQ